MRVLYGIQSTGNGHLTRSAKIINRLIKAGCMVDVLTSGNNSQVKFPFPIK
jgi:UDP:flavonoid glycosyltransferase YjiC (YdhE family)